MSRQLPKIAVLVLSGLLWSAGCRPAGAGEADGTRTARVGLVGAVHQLDPHAGTGLSQTVWTNIYESLFVLNPEGEIEPALALSYQWVDDRHLRIELREGVRFHDGTPFNAETASHSVARMIDPENPGADISYYSSIAEVSPAGEHSVLLRLFAPDRLLPRVLGTSFLAMTPAHLAGSLATRPIGTGPWKFVEWRDGQFVKLARHDQWWGRPRPASEVLIFRLFKEETTRILSLRRRDIDIAFNLLPRAGSVLGQDPGVRMIVTDTPRVLFLLLNVRRAPTDDVRVRQAISLALDSRRLAAQIVGPNGTPLQGLVPGRQPESSSWRYAPDQARLLLAEAGWQAGPDGLRRKNGQPLRLRWASAEQRDPFNRDLATAAQEMLRQVGIEVELVFADFSSIIREALEPDPGRYHVIGPKGLSGILRDPIHYFLQFRERSASPRTAGGESRFTSPEVELLISSYLACSDPLERRGILERLQAEVGRQVPVIPLYNARRQVGVLEDVAGFADHYNEWYPYRYLRVHR